jgi:hypothetical protein
MSYTVSPNRAAMSLRTLKQEKDATKIPYTKQVVGGLSKRAARKMRRKAKLSAQHKLGVSANGLFVL